MIAGAFAAVLMVLVLMALGYLTAHMGWISEGTLRFIPKLIINVTLPATIVVSFLDGLTAEGLGETWVYFVVPIVAVVATLIISFAVTRIAGVGKQQKGVFATLYTFSNSGFMGLPVALAIFGEKGMLYALFYFGATMALMNSVGYLLIEQDGAARLDAPSKDTTKSGAAMLRQVLTPPVIAIALSLVLVALGIGLASLPQFLDMSLTMLADITSPLALLFVGMQLHKTGIRAAFTLDKQMAHMLIGRFVIAPLVTYLVCTLFGLDPFAKAVLVVQSGLPAMVSIAIFAAGSDADSDFAARGVALSSILSFVAIPLYVALLAV